jgi:hypothetical protein
MIESLLTVQLYLGSNARNLVDSPWNYSNSYAALASNSLFSELRPQLKSTLNDFSFTARPRFIRRFAWTPQSTVSSTGMSYATGASVSFSEAFVTYPVSENVSVSYGLLNFQWGPGESSSPSNRIFRDSVFVKDFIYDVAGQHGVKLSFTPVQEWSFQFYSVVSDAGVPEYEADESFEYKGVAKAEYSFSGGRDYLGTTVGLREGGQGWFGEYGSVEIFDGMALIFDAGHVSGSRNWYPVEAPLGLFQFEQSYRASSILQTTLNLGLRYSFVNGSDARLEWLYQSHGYSAEELVQSHVAVQLNHVASNSIFESNIRRALKTGLEYPGRSTLLMSLRVPDVFSRQRWNAYLRGLLSTTDGSGLFYLNFEIPSGNSGTWFLDFLKSFGSERSELRGLVNLSTTVGYRYSL